MWRCRLLLDRAHTDLDSVYQNLDSDPEPEHPASSSSPPPALSSPLRDSNTSTSDTITSGSSRLLPAPPSSCPSSSSVAVDLARVLLSVKSCRWRHFRPRTLPHDPSGAGFMSRRGLLRRFQRTGSGLSRPLGGGGPAPGRPAPPPVNGEPAHSFSSSGGMVYLCCFVVICHHHHQLSVKVKGWCSTLLTSDHWKSFTVLPFQP